MGNTREYLVGDEVDLVEPTPASDGEKVAKIIEEHEDGTFAVKFPNGKTARVKESEIWGRLNR